MITEPSQIKTSLEKYVSAEDGKPLHFLYRLEWYRIGISIPMDVYCDKEPALQIRPECQLTNTEEFSVLSEEADEVSFKLFAVPYKTAKKNEDLENEFLEEWLKKELKGVAQLDSIEFGANNRIYYKSKPSDSTLSQIQSYSLKGRLKVIDREKLFELLKTPVGYYPELGCGMLLIE